MAHDHSSRPVAQRGRSEVGAAPESSIFCFRVDGSDERQLEVRRRLLAGGRHYVSSAVFRGRRWLRLALMSPATDAAELDRLAAAVRAAAAEAP